MWHVSRRSQLSLLLFATSPVTFTFLLRPFSNTLETVLLALVFLISTKVPGSARAASHLPFFFLGVALAVGIFTRITFVAFATPLVLCTAAVVARQGRSQVLLVSVPFGPSRIHRPHQVDLVPLRSADFPRLVLPGICTLAGFIGTAASCIAVDTTFYSSDKVSIRSGLGALADLPALVVAPLNLLRYNVSSDNLAEHGLHPRWLHVVVNAPMLFGAGLVIVAAGAADSLQPARAGLKPFDREYLVCPSPLSPSHVSRLR